MTSEEIAALIDRFNDAWNAHDLETALDLCAADAVFDSTGPAPDGTRHHGRDALRAAWEPVIRDRRSHFTFEDGFAAGDRFVQQWRYDWGEGHVRGVDVFTVRDGLIAEKRSYVKG